MPTKINLSTPPKELHDTVVEEARKAQLWYAKKMGGEKKAIKACMEVAASLPKYELASAHGPIVEYHPSSGNEWISLQSIYNVPGGETFIPGTVSCCIWQTEGSIGIFLPIFIEKDDEHPVQRTATLAFTGHFFQRYHERIGGIDPADKGQAKEVAAQFLVDNPSNFLHLEGKKNIEAYFRIKGAIGYGKVISSDPMVIEVRTVIPDSMLSPKQIKETKSIRKSYEEWYNEMFIPTPEQQQYADDAKFYETVNKNVNTIIGKIASKSDFKKYHRLIQGHKDRIMAIFSSCVGRIRDISGEAVPWSSLQWDEFTFEAVIAAFVGTQNFRGSASAKKAFDLDISSKAFSAIARHNGYDISQQQMKGLIGILYDDDTLADYEQLKQQYIMNQQAISIFKNLLSRQGLKKKFDKYSSAIDDNSDRYLQRVETLYPISRFLPQIVDIKDKDKFTNCNKLWLDLVVENSFSPQLTPYVEKYGKQSVCDALRYLIDNDCWVSPLDKKGLKVPQPDNFDGLKDIPMAIDSLNAQRKSQEAQPEEAEMIEVVDLTPAPKPVSDVHNKYNIALRNVQALVDSISALQTNADAIKEYLTLQDASALYNDELEAVTAKFAKEKQDLEEENDLLAREVDDLTEQIKTSQQRLHMEEKNRKAAEESAYMARQERKTALEERDNARAELRKATENLEELRLMAKDSPAQRCKILPFNKLNELYGFGPGTIKMLREFLRGYNIFFDDERKK